MRRRTLLASAATALALPLAGCAHPTDGSLSMGALDGDSAIADRYAGSSETLPPEMRDLVTATIEGEAPTTEGTTPLFESPRPVEYEGAYYRISHEVVASRTAVRYEIEVDYDPAETPEPVIAYADLPDADRAALEGLIPPGEEPPTGEGFDIGTATTYPEDAESVLVPEPQYEGVSYDGSTYRVRIAGSRDVTVQTYEYSAEQVADSADAMGRQLRERYLFTLSGLSEAEREIVAEAADGSYFPEGEASDAFRSLADRFRAQEGIETTEHGGTWLVRYDGTIYWTDLQYPPETDA